MSEIIRALSWNQPYASLMLLGKIETRLRPTNVRGKVLICSCIKPYTDGKVYTISGTHQKIRILHGLNKFYNGEPYALPTGMAIAIADLVDCRKMEKYDEDKCYVQYHHELYCWIFENVQAIEPFPYKGSQGWSILDQATKDKIKIIS